MTNTETEGFLNDLFSGGFPFIAAHFKVQEKV
jgi:hypothetical protein